MARVHAHMAGLGQPAISNARAALLLPAVGTARAVQMENASVNEVGPDHRVISSALGLKTIPNIGRAVATGTAMDGL